MTTFLASFPSPPQGVWHLGIVPIRAYALFIIVGIIVALVIGDRRWVARGGEQGVIYDIALWAVPFGLIGGRLYHVMTDWRTYFGDAGAGFVAALRIWDGGLGIWGAVALGGVGAWIACRQRGIPLPAFGDAIAPGIVLAQAIGRLGNYFNQELYGRETSVPWGLKIYERRDASGAIDYLNGVSTGHVEKIVQPTFLYELLWNVVVFAILIYADRRFKLGHGRLFALYVAAYCVGRFGVELLRDDTATHIAGIRINLFTSVFVFIGAVVYIMVAPKGREDPATLVGKPRVPPEEAKAKPKKAVPEKVVAGEDSALVEWTKELAAVAAPSGVVAGVAVAAEHDEDHTEQTSEGDDVDWVDDEATAADDAGEREATDEGDAQALEERAPTEPDAEELGEAAGEKDETEAAEPEEEPAEELAAEEVGEPQPEAVDDEAAADLSTDEVDTVAVDQEEEAEPPAEEAPAEAASEEVEGPAIAPETEEATAGGETEAADEELAEALAAEEEGATAAEQEEGTEAAQPQPDAVDDEEEASEEAASATEPDAVDDDAAENLAADEVDTVAVDQEEGAEPPAEEAPAEGASEEVEGPAIGLEPGEPAAGGETEAADEEPPEDLATEEVGDAAAEQEDEKEAAEEPAEAESAAEPAESEPAAEAEIREGPQTPPARRRFRLPRFRNRSQ